MSKKPKKDTNPSTADTTTPGTSPALPPTLEAVPKVPTTPEEIRAGMKFVATIDGEPHTIEILPPDKGEEGSWQIKYQGKNLPTVQSGALSASEVLTKISAEHWELPPKTLTATPSAPAQPSLQERAEKISAEVAAAHSPEEAALLKAIFGLSKDEMKSAGRELFNKIKPLLGERESRFRITPTKGEPYVITVTSPLKEGVTAFKFKREDKTKEEDGNLGFIAGRMNKGERWELLPPKEVDLENLPQGTEILDLADPAHPVLLRIKNDISKGTDKSRYECGGQDRTTGRAIIRLYTPKFLKSGKKGGTIIINPTDDIKQQRLASLQNKKEKSPPPPNAGKRVVESLGLGRDEAISLRIKHNIVEDAIVSYNNQQYSVGKNPLGAIQSLKKVPLVSILDGTSFNVDIAAFEEKRAVVIIKKEKEIAVEKLDAKILGLAVGDRLITIIERGGQKQPDRDFTITRLDVILNDPKRGVLMGCEGFYDDESGKRQTSFFRYDRIAEMRRRNELETLKTSNEGAPNSEISEKEYFKKGSRFFDSLANTVITVLESSDVQQQIPGKYPIGNCKLEIQNADGSTVIEYMDADDIRRLIESEAYLDDAQKIDAFIAALPKKPTPDAPPSPPSSPPTPAGAALEMTTPSDTTASAEEPPSHTPSLAGSGVESELTSEKITAEKLGFEVGSILMYPKNRGDQGWQRIQSFDDKTQNCVIEYIDPKNHRLATKSIPYKIFERWKTRGDFNVNEVRDSLFEPLIDLLEPGTIITYQNGSIATLGESKLDPKGVVCWPAKWTKGGSTSFYDNDIKNALQKGAWITFPKYQPTSAKEVRGSLAPELFTAENLHLKNGSILCELDSEGNIASMSTVGMLDANAARISKDGRKGVLLQLLVSEDQKKPLERAGFTAYEDLSNAIEAKAMLVLEKGFTFFDTKEKGMVTLLETPTNIYGNCKANLTLSTGEIRPFNPSLRLIREGFASGRYLAEAPQVAPNPQEEEPSILDGTETNQDDAPPGPTAPLSGRGDNTESLFVPPDNILSTPPELTPETIASQTPEELLRDLHEQGIIENVTLNVTVRIPTLIGPEAIPVGYWTVTRIILARPDSAAAVRALGGIVRLRSGDNSTQISLRALVEAPANSFRIIPPTRETPTPRPLPPLSAPRVPFDERDESTTLSTDAPSETRSENLGLRPDQITEEDSVVPALDISHLSEESTPESESTPGIRRSTRGLSREEIEEELVPHLDESAPESESDSDLLRDEIGGEGGETTENRFSLRHLITIAERNLNTELAKPVYARSTIEEPGLLAGLWRRFRGRERGVTRVESWEARGGLFLLRAARRIEHDLELQETGAARMALRDLRPILHAFCLHSREFIEITIGPLQRELVTIGEELSVLQGHLASLRQHNDHDRRENIELRERLRQQHRDDPTYNDEDYHDDLAAIDELLRTVPEETAEAELSLTRLHTRRLAIHEELLLSTTGRAYQEFIGEERRLARLLHLPGVTTVRSLRTRIEAARRRLPRPPSSPPPAPPTH